jgi:hypothetical protein
MSHNKTSFKDWKEARRKRAFELKGLGSVVLKHLHHHLGKKLLVMWEGCPIHPPRPGQRLARYRDVSLSAPEDGALPTVGRPLDDHRRPRRSHRDRQDPHSSLLAHQSTAPSTRAAIRPTPNDLLPTRSPIQLGSAPEPTLPLGLHSPKTPKCAETWRLKPINDPEILRSWTEISRD